MNMPLAMAWRRTLRVRCSDKLMLLLIEVIEAGVMRGMALAIEYWEMMARERLSCCCRICQSIVGVLWGSIAFSR